MTALRCFYICALVLFFHLQVTSCKRNGPIHIQDIDQYFNSQINFRQGQYFYIENYEKVSMEVLADSILLHANAHLDFIKSHSKSHYRQLYYKKGICRHDFDQLVDADGDSPFIVGNSKRLVCLVAYTKMFDEPLLYSRGLNIRVRAFELTQYQTIDYIVFDNDSIIFLKDYPESILSDKTFDFNF